MKTKLFPERLKGIRKERSRFEKLGYELERKRSGIEAILDKTKKRPVPIWKETEREMLNLWTRGKIRRRCLLPGRGL